MFSFRYFIIVCHLFCVHIPFHWLFLGFVAIFSELTLKDALDIVSEVEPSSGFRVPRTIYIQPPDHEDYNSGEDDADNDADGIPDNVCGSLLVTIASTMVHSQ